ncbi:hypothetical protein Vafri_3304 [Volvox africanus]|uniref:Uncharacterized protein n=1 Tax=Volvox africanus TaxID=51714 RepID=A0A8J4AR85_9CHLO|nr:hypothetical protein Vafri_3304 [Volvox africanus]
MQLRCVDDDVEGLQYICRMYSVVVRVVQGDGFDLEGLYQPGLLNEVEAQGRQRVALGGILQRPAVELPAVSTSKKPLYLHSVVLVSFGRKQENAVQASPVPLTHNGASPATS